MSATVAPIRPRVTLPDVGPRRDDLRSWRRRLAAWLWTGAGMTFLILVVGGITRLTQSGLSIVDWQPIVGVIPPIGEAQWQEAFERYRQFPEYQRLRAGMTLSEFRFIFFWEYLHRVAARLIGIVFLAPFLFFWWRGYFGAETMRVRRALVLFALGALQGFAGWYMVSSGLVDHPYVSHYRLAVHLAIAFAIFGCCVWFALDVRGPERAPLQVSADQRRRLVAGLTVIGALLAPQILWGALVAGLKAGLFHNTFPLMGGALMPAAAWGMEPWLRNLFENPIAVQWVHRVFGTALGLAAFAFYLRVRSRGPWDYRSRSLNALLLGTIAAQYLLGVLTLLLRVPVSLGVAHQAMAMVIFGVWLLWLHHARRMMPTTPPAGLLRGA